MTSRVDPQDAENDDKVTVQVHRSDGSVDTYLVQRDVAARSAVVRPTRDSLAQAVADVFDAHVDGGLDCEPNSFDYEFADAILARFAVSDSQDAKLAFESIPIERHWALSMRLHVELKHIEPWEICHEGCDALASDVIRLLFGVAVSDSQETREVATLHCNACDAMQVVRAVNDRVDINSAELAGWSFTSEDGWLCPLEPVSVLGADTPRAEGNE